MSGWFSTQIVHTGRLPLLCFFVAFVLGFAAIRLSVRLNPRAGPLVARECSTPGDLHVHHMVFGVVSMAAGGVAKIAVPAPPTGLARRRRGGFGLGTALVLDESR